LLTYPEAISNLIFLENSADHIVKLMKCVQ